MCHTNVDDGLVFLHRAQDIQTAELPFSTLGGEYGRGADASVYRSGFFVDEGKRFLGETSSISRWIRCAACVAAYSDVV